jgi:hypothetical protein
MRTAELCNGRLPHFIGMRGTTSRGSYTIWMLSGVVLFGYIEYLSSFHHKPSKFSVLLLLQYHCVLTLLDYLQGDPCKLYVAT